MIRSRWLEAAIVLTLFAASCGREGTSTLYGRAMVEGKPAPGAEVNVYVSAEKSNAPPAAAVKSDEGGRFAVVLKPGTYYVVIKQASPSGGPPRVSKIPADPVLLGKRALDIGDVKLSSGAGKGTPVPGSGVRGRVLREGKPAVGAMVYLYANTDSGLKGPSHYISERTGLDGGFSLNAEPGRYFLAACKRLSGQSAGELEPGDLSGSYEHNPLAVAAGGYVEIGDLVISEIDSAKLAGRKLDKGEKAGAPGISGRVTTADGKAVSGVYVVAYDDYRMVGKPKLVSERTGADGTYQIVFDAPGRYYVGARSTLGGPLEPGDMVGVYGGSKDNSITAGNKGCSPGVDIVVREVE